MSGLFKIKNVVVFSRPYFVR